MAIRQRGAGWQADIQHEGKRYRETFGSEAEARAWESAARAALKKGQAVPKPSSVDSEYKTIEALVRRVEQSRWANKDGAVHQAVYAQRFLDFVGPKTGVAEALTQDNVEDWLAKEAKERGLALATINRHKSAISVLVKRAMSVGLLQRKIDLNWQAENEHRLRWFTDEEEALILQTFRLWGRERWADFFVFLVDTGARTWTEAGRLKWNDVSAKPRMASFYETKNGQGRAVPLTTRAWDAVQRQRDGSKAGPWVDLPKDDGRRLYDRLRAHLPQLEDTVWYTCRHTFASRLVQRGANLYRVQKLMGHKSIAQTERYAKLAPVNLIETVQLLEPQACPEPSLRSVAA